MWRLYIRTYVRNLVPPEIEFEVELNMDPKVLICFSMRGLPPESVEKKIPQPPLIVLA